MSLKIYGAPITRAYRNIWMARELGLSYELFPVMVSPGAEIEPELLRLNPNKRVPAIDDGGYALYESLAINLYLASRYGRTGEAPLWPTTPQGEGLAYQWSLWAANEVEPQCLAIVLHTVGYAEDKRDPARVTRGVEELQRPLAVLNQSLADREYLVEGRFMVADLNPASVLAWLRMSKVDVGGFPAVAAWMDRCLTRPAARDARKG